MFLAIRLEEAFYILVVSVFLEIADGVYCTGKI